MTKSPKTSPSPDAAADSRWAVLDLLATLTLWVREDGLVLFANSATEDVLGVPRRSIEGDFLQHYFVDGAALSRALQGARKEQFSALRYDAHLQRAGQEAFPVHVIVAPAWQGPQ